MDRLEQRLQDFLGILKVRQTQRILYPLCPGLPGTVRSNDGRVLLNFSSNDYLGLSGHPKLIERACQWAEAYGVGATASRLVCGTSPLYEKLEAKLAVFKGTEAALILNSGFQANSTILPALFDSGLLKNRPVVLVDRLVHASVYYGCAAAGVRPVRFRHNDLDHLEFLLKKYSGPDSQPFILTESVFSMDGDRADLAGISSLSDRFGAVLYVDEAHATGMFGPGGVGLASAEASGHVDVIVGTFGKALGGFGAYVSCSRQLRDYLVNRCAGFIYSTALPPPILGAIEAAIDLVPFLEVERARVLATASRLRATVAEVGLDSANSSTQIVPVLVGNEFATLATSQMLEQEHALLVVAIRPPAVPVGTSRLRFTVTAAHGVTAIDRLLAAIPAMADLLKRLPCK